MLQLLPTVFCFAMVFGLLATWAVREGALRMNLVSAPAGDRHVHTAAIPRIGGLAVFLAFCCSMLVADVVLKLLGLHDFNIGITHTSLKGVIAASAVVFAIGLLDDIVGCTPLVKVICEAGAASLAYAAGVRIGSFPFFGQQFGTLMGYVVTVGFIIFVTNAFNLLDGLDGLAAGSALVSTIGLAAAAALNHRNPILLVTIGLAGALISFLRFNFAPATIFLGDSGSLFIGFLLSCVAIAGTQKLPTVVAAAVPLLIFAVPLLDTSLSVGRRVLRGQPIFAADRDHIHHRLLLRGVSHKQAVLAIYGVSGACASLMLMILYREKSTVLVIAFASIVLAAFVAKMRYPDLAALRSAFHRFTTSRRNLSRSIRLRSTLQEVDSFSGQALLDRINDILAPECELEVHLSWHSPARPQAANLQWVFQRPLRAESGVQIGTLVVQGKSKAFSLDVDFIEQIAGLLERNQLLSFARRSAVASQAVS